ncbi:MAG: TetR/AcrR family transcriptional regulator [Pseudomonadales bacterium]
MPETQRVGPKGTATDVRQALIEAGCQMYAEHGLQGVSLREVADRAGVNQAMVRYYFKDKNGFELAMLDSGAQRLIAALPEDADFESTFRAAVSTLNGMPWFPILVMRTVHIGDSLREYFMSTYVPTIMARLGRHVAGDSKFGFLSVLSLLVMPQITRQMVNEILGIQFDDEFAASYATHVNRLVAPKI